MTAMAATPGGVATAAIVSVPFTEVRRAASCAPPALFEVVAVVGRRGVFPREDDDAALTADAGAFGGQIAVGSEREVDDAALGGRHWFEFECDALAQHAAGTALCDRLQRRYAPRSIAFDVDQEEEIARVLAVHHRIGDRGQRLEHRAVLADQDRQITGFAALVAVIASAAWRVPVDRAYIDRDLAPVASRVDAAERNARRQSERGDQTGQEISRLEVGIAVLRRTAWLTCHGCFTVALAVALPIRRSIAAPLPGTATAIGPALSARTALTVSVHELFFAPFPGVFPPDGAPSPLAFACCTPLSDDTRLTFAPQFSHLLPLTTVNCCLQFGHSRG